VIAVFPFAKKMTDRPIMMHTLACQGWTVICYSWRAQVLHYAHTGTSRGCHACIGSPSGKRAGGQCMCTPFFSFHLCQKKTKRAEVKACKRLPKNTQRAPNGSWLLSFYDLTY
jgi:hypothetical protein